MKGIKYKVTRVRSVYSSDNNNIPSNCTQIDFTNEGDTPVKILIDGQGETLKQGESSSFGSDHADTEEITSFEIQFSALVTTQKILVDRIYKIPTC